MTAAVARSLRLFCPDFNLLLCYIWRDSFSSRSTANGGVYMRYKCNGQLHRGRQTDRRVCASGSWYGTDAPVPTSRMRNVKCRPAQSPPTRFFVPHPILPLYSIRT